MRENVGSLETIGGLVVKGIAGKEPSKIGGYEIKPDYNAPIREVGDKLIQSGAKEFEAAEEIKKSIAGNDKASQFAVGILSSIPDMVISAGISGAQKGRQRCYKLTLKELGKTFETM